MQPVYLIAVICLAGFAGAEWELPFPTVSPIFPYTLSMESDKDVVYDMPMTVNLTLTPINSSYTSTPKFYYHWIDFWGPFDCPHRLNRTYSPSPLLSVYNVTYHYQFMRCPPLWRLNGTRMIGVEVYDDPNFDPRWSRPLASMMTEIKLIEHPVVYMAVREIKFEEPWYYEGEYHLKERIYGISSGESDKYQVMRWANATRYWSITHYTLPHENFGRIMMHVFNYTGTYDLRVDTTLYMKMPPYPGLEGNRTMVKTGSNTTRIKIIDKVHDLKLIMQNNSIILGDTWEPQIFVNGGFCYAFVSGKTFL